MILQYHTSWISTLCVHLSLHTYWFKLSDMQIWWPVHLYLYNMLSILINCIHKLNALCLRYVNKSAMINPFQTCLNFGPYPSLFGVDYCSNSNTFVYQHYHNENIEKSYANNEGPVFTKIVHPSFEKKTGTVWIKAVVLRILPVRACLICQYCLESQNEQEFAHVLSMQYLFFSNALF